MQVFIAARLYGSLERIHRKAEKFNLQIATWARLWKKIKSLCFFQQQWEQLWDDDDDFSVYYIFSDMEIMRCVLAKFAQTFFSHASEVIREREVSTTTDLFFPYIAHRREQYSSLVV